MSRNRNASDQWMPTRVYRGRSAYEFRPKSGGAVRLCSLDSSKSVVWKKYEEVNELQNMNTVEKLINEFYKSPDFLDKSTRTQIDYGYYKKDLLLAFGKMNVNKVEPKHVRMFMDKKAIKSGITQANRHKSSLQVIFAWAYERGKIKTNPCIGVKKFKEKPRERYVTEPEYEALLDAACPIVFITSEIAYRCMARVDDVLKLKQENLTPEGIYIKQGKTGIAQIKEWNNELTGAIEFAKTINPSISSEFVIHKATGGSFTYGGFRERWLEAMERARNETGFLMDFTFHDLKAKGITDLKGTLEDKRAASGHTTLQQTADYVRKPQIVRTVGSKRKDAD